MQVLTQHQAAVDLADRLVRDTCHTPNAFDRNSNLKKIGRPLLSLACRHHILELTVATVHETFFRQKS